MRSIFSERWIYLLIWMGLMVNACTESAVNKETLPDALRSVTLVHPSEDPVSVAIPLKYFSNDSFISARADDERTERKTISILFAYPFEGEGAEDIGGVPVGDCIEQTKTCRFYASMRVAKPGATVAFFNSVYSYREPGDVMPIEGMQSYSGLSENLLAYFHEPDEEFPSGVLASCIRASRKNIAGCRIFFETESRLSVVLGGLKDHDLPRWKMIVSDVARLVDNFIV